MSRVRNFLIALGLSSALVTGGVLIAEHEGEVLSSYIDPVGIETACFGKTGAEIELGQVYSQQDCLSMLADDLEVYNRQLLNLTRVELTDGEHAAYLSFIYNVGASAFASSTLRKKLQAGDRVGACHQLSRWVYAKGERLQGLVNRREHELKICLRDIQ